VQYQVQKNGAVQPTVPMTALKKRVPHRVCTELEACRHGDFSKYQCHFLGERLIFSDKAIQGFGRLSWHLDFWVNFLGVGVAKHVSKYRGHGQEPPVQGKFMEITEGQSLLFLIRVVLPDRKKKGSGGQWWRGKGGSLGLKKGLKQYYNPAGCEVSAHRPVWTSYWI